MVPEAPLERTEHGLAPAGEGWFVLNARDAQWFDGGELGGLYASFEGESRFAQVGFGIGVSRPGVANARYHAEDAQEDFLVLAGERRLKAWDFVHLPPWTEHIFVGLDEPCLVVAVGARRPGRGLRFPMSELALKHNAGVREETSDSREAYAGYSDPTPIERPPAFDALTES